MEIDKEEDADTKDGDLEGHDDWFCSEAQALPVVVESLDVFAAHLTSKVSARQRYLPGYFVVSALCMCRIDSAWVFCQQLGAGAVVVGIAFWAVSFPLACSL